MGSSFTPELIRLLREAGCKFERPGKDDHDIWFSPIPACAFRPTTKSSHVIPRTRCSNRLVYRRDFETIVSDPNGKAEYLSGYQLRLTFSDGAHGDYDFSRLLANDTVLTHPLKTPDVFKSFFIELGALCWKNGLEFSPAALHRELQSAGKLVASQEAA